MRLIGNLPTESDANHFSAWLLTQSVECQVEPDGQNGFDIWVKDEDKLEKAKGELDEFQNDPKAQKYRDAIGEARKLQEVELKRRKQYQKNVQAGPAATQKGIFESAPLTMVLILISIIVAVLSNFGDESKGDRAITRALQFVAVDAPDVELQQKAASNPDNLDVRLASVYRGELWRTISPIFYHYGTFHIVFNMLWLVHFGRMIEARYGTVCLAMIVVFSAIFSNVLQCVVPADLGGSFPRVFGDVLITSFGGMSGVNYALFGFIWFRMLYDPNARMQLTQVTVVIMIGYLFYCMVSPQIGGGLMGGDGGRVANWAHGGGMVMGLLLGLSPIGKRFGRKRS